MSYYPLQIPTNIENTTYNIRTTHSHPFRGGSKVREPNTSEEADNKKTCENINIKKMKRQILHKAPDLNLSPG